MSNEPEEITETPAFIAALQAQDAEAWALFIRHYGQKLYGYLANKLPTHESVEDVLAEILMAMVSTIGQWVPEVKLSTFVYSIANRKVADYWRRRTTTVELADLPHTETRDLLAQLPEATQDVLLLRYYVGLSIAEIAQILGRPMKATESLLRRARQQLLEISTAPPETLIFEPKVEHNSLEVKNVFGAVYPLLLLQKLLNQQNGMSEEAQIFAHAQRQVEQMATTTPATSFPEALRRIVQEAILPDPMPLLQQLLLLQQFPSRHYHYNTSGQL